MINIYSKWINTHDLNGNTDGMMESRIITFYDQDDKEIPTWEENTTPPFLMVEEIDERPTGIFDSTTGKEVVLLKPVATLELDKKQAEFIKKWFE